MKYQKVWEKVTESTVRMKVPFGWLVSKDIWRDSREGTGCSIKATLVIEK